MKRMCDLLTRSKKIMKRDLTTYTYETSDIQFQSINAVNMHHLATFFSESFAGTVDDEHETLAEWCDEIKNFTLNKYRPFIAEASFVVTHNESAIAAITCSLFRNIPLITYIVTHPRFQRQSLGKELLNKTLVTLKNLNYTDVYLVVSSDNLPGINLYQQIGFQSFEYNWEIVLNN